MQKLSDVAMSPTGWDSMANYAGDIPDDKWFVVMGRNRDSDVLTNSNWDVALEMLGGESETVEIVRFGHWACGWIEYLCVSSEDVEKVKIGEDIQARIESYPVLDEDHFSEAEMEEANDIWSRCYDKRDRIEYIRRYRNQFEFHSFSDLMSNVRGDYFSGYASELCQP